MSDDLPPSITRAEFKKLPEGQRGQYMEGVWRKCDQCNPYTPDENCPCCCGNGVYLRMQFSAQVTDARDRVESDVPPGWNMGDPL